VLREIEALPPDARAKLREMLNASTEIHEGEQAARAFGRAASLRDFSADRQWLADHRDQYAGQWVAVKYGDLISASTNAKEVFAATRTAGHPDPLVVFVEPRDGQPVINLG
jgi:hypothetical protein